MIFSVITNGDLFAAEVLFPWPASSQVLLSRMADLFEVLLPFIKWIKIVPSQRLKVVLFENGYRYFHEIKHSPD